MAHSKTLGSKLLKTPVGIIKQLAVEVQEVFARCSDIFTEFPVISSQIVFIRDIASLHIAAEQGNLELCEHILEKTEDKNPTGHMKMKFGHYKVVDALTPLGIAILKGHFEIFSLVMNQVSFKKFDLDLDSETPLNLAAVAGHFEIFKVLWDFFQGAKSS